MFKENIIVFKENIIVFKENMKCLRMRPLTATKMFKENIIVFKENMNTLVPNATSHREILFYNKNNYITIISQLK